MEISVTKVITEQELKTVYTAYFAKNGQVFQVGTWLPELFTRTDPINLKSLQDSGGNVVNQLIQKHGLAGTIDVRKLQNNDAAVKMLTARPEVKSMIALIKQEDKIIVESMEIATTLSNIGSKLRSFKSNQDWFAKAPGSLQEWTSETLLFQKRFNTQFAAYVSDLTKFDNLIKTIKCTHNLPMLIAGVLSAGFAAIWATAKTTQQAAN